MDTYTLIKGGHTLVQVSFSDLTYLDALWHDRSTLHNIKLSKSLPANVDSKHVAQKSVDCAKDQSQIKPLSWAKEIDKRNLKHAKTNVPYVRGVVLFENILEIIDQNLADIDADKKAKKEAKKDATQKFLDSVMLSRRYRMYKNEPSKVINYLVTKAYPNADFISDFVCMIEGKKVVINFDEDFFTVDKVKFKNFKWNIIMLGEYIKELM
jgi:hypothetical protein